MLGGFPSEAADAMNGFLGTALPPLPPVIAPLFQPIRVSLKVLPLVNVGKEVKFAPHGVAVAFSYLARIGAHLIEQRLQPARQPVERRPTIGLDPLPIRVLRAASASQLAAKVRVEAHAGRHGRGGLT
jgi:hypothetical protein